MASEFIEKKLSSKNLLDSFIQYANNTKRTNRNNQFTAFDNQDEPQLLESLGKIIKS